jgi:hypothetical protein
MLANDGKQLKVNNLDLLCQYTRVHDTTNVDYLRRHSIHNSNVTALNARATKLQTTSRLAGID